MLTQKLVILRNEPHALVQIWFRVHRLTGIHFRRFARRTVAQGKPRIDSAGFRGARNPNRDRGRIRRSKRKPTGAGRVRSSDAARGIVIISTRRRDATALRTTACRLPFSSSISACVRTRCILAFCRRTTQVANTRRHVTSG